MNMRSIITAVGVASILVVSGCGSADDTMSSEDRGSDVVSGDQNSASEPGGGDTEATADTEAPATNIEVVESGFANMAASSEYDDPDGTGVAVLHNPSERIARNVEAQLTLLDATGGVLKSETVTVAALLPGASVAVSMVAPGIEGVASVKVQARASDWEDSKSDLGELTVSGMNIRAQEYGGADVNGMVSSTAGQDLEDVYMSILFRDATGAPVAGTFNYIEFIPANGESPFTISTMNDIPADWTVEGFAAPSWMTLMAD